MPTAVQSFCSNLQLLLAHRAGIRNGDADAIHGARVATRRLRAALPILTWGSAGRGEEPDEVIKTAGRALGKARDVDVAIELLDELERRSPETAPAAATLRARLLPKQVKRRRALIKKFENLQELESLERLPRLAPRGRVATFYGGGRSAVLVGHLAATLAEHATELQERMSHATGVYFPNRAHRVRVAIKKVRYAAELLDEDGSGLRKRALRAFKNAQEALGQVHDREMLLRLLEDADRRHGVPAAGELSRVLEAECREIFSRYRASRDAVVAAARELNDWCGRRLHRPGPARAFTVGALAVPTATATVFLLARRLRQAS